MKNWMKSWKEKITKALELNGETWSDVESHTLDDNGLNTPFDDSYGVTEGLPFTLWTKDFVYFPACYDGSEWVASVPRNPNGKPTEHVGG